MWVNPVWDRLLHLKNQDNNNMFWGRCLLPEVLKLNLNLHVQKPTSGIIYESSNEADLW